MKPPGAHDRPLDPRWEWIEVPEMGKPPGTLYLRGACRHTEVIDVESLVTGDVLSRLCVTCDTQFEVPQN